MNLVVPFCRVRIDYTSHIYVKEDKAKRKYYILIFTCLNVRECHIEFIPVISKNHFVLDLVRFCNEYGFPDTVYND